MKKIVIAFMLLMLVIVFPSSIEARSGCCSHHGGVVGCQCGDGTPLSATCRPYYPECNGSAVKTFVATNTPKPTPKPTRKPTRIPTRKPTKKPTPTKKISSKKLVPKKILSPTRIPTVSQ